MVEKTVACRVRLLRELWVAKKILVSGTENEGVGMAAVMGGVGQGLGQLVPYSGLYSLKQARHFGPQRVSTMFSSANARQISTSYAVSSLVVGVPNLLGKSSYSEAK